MVNKEDLVKSYCMGRLDSLCWDLGIKVEKLEIVPTDRAYTAYERNAKVKIQNLARYLRSVNVLGEDQDKVVYALCDILGVNPGDLWG